MTTAQRPTQQLALLTIGLVICAAVWEVDPRWITENVGGLSTIDQGEVNQRAAGGSQRIVWLGAPLALALGLLATRTAGWSPTRLSNRFDQRPIDWFGLWLCWSLVGAVVGPRPDVAFLFTMSAACIVGTTRLLTRHNPNLTAGVMPAALAVFVAGSILVKLAGLSDLRVRDGRLTMLSLEANQFGRMATFAVLGGLYLAIEAGNRTTRFSGAVGAVAGLGVLLLTASRTGIAATVIAILVVLFSKRNRRTLVGVGSVGVLACVGVLATGLGRSGAQRLVERSTEDTDSFGSLTGRTDVWPMVIETIGRRPLGGQGFGNDLMVLSAESYKVHFIVEHAHNLWLHVSLTTGIVGLGFLLAAAVQAVRRARPPMRPWVLGFLAYFAIAGISEAMLRNPDISFIALAFAFALAERGPRRHNTRDTTAESKVAVDAEPTPVGIN